MIAIVVLELTLYMTFYAIKAILSIGLRRLDNIIIYY